MVIKGVDSMNSMINTMYNNANFKISGVVDSSTIEVKGSIEDTLCLSKETLDIKKFDETIWNSEIGSKIMRRRMNEEKLKFEYQVRCAIEECGGIPVETGGEKYD